jgi:hypothetical protein
MIESLWSAKMRVVWLGGSRGRRTRNNSTPELGPPPNGKEWDREDFLRACARAKMGQGKSLTSAESAALKRVERAEEDKLRQKFYASIPKKDYTVMSGRQRKVLLEQAARYGMPIGGETISLPDLARWLHDFLAKNSHRLLGDPKTDAAEEATIRSRNASARLMEMEYAQKIGKLIEREDVGSVIGECVARCIGVMDSTENSIGAQVDALLTDPKFMAMPAEERQRKIRESVHMIHDNARRMEAESVDSMLANAKANNVTS